MTVSDVPLTTSRERTRITRRWLIGIVLLIVGVAAGMAFLDRALAEFTHAHLMAQRPFFVALTHIVDPAPVLASLMLLWTLAQIARGRALNRIEAVLLRVAISVCAAVMIKDQLKWAFGRTWPETWVNNNPSWFGNGTYGFFPFHGGQGWFAFPSGHTTVICAVTAVLWIRWPRGRPLYALAALGVTVGLIGADYHWLSDIFAGAALGTAVGLVSATFGLQRTA